MTEFDKKLNEALSNLVNINFTWTKPGEYPNDDGSGTAAVEDILGTVGAEVEDWEGDSLLIVAPADKVAVVKELVGKMQAGVFGALPQAIVRSYVFDDFWPLD
jgi:hypothetical protein